MTIVLAACAFTGLAGRIAVAAPATPTIGAEALQPLPHSALWNYFVNFRPGNGEVVHLNPPRFSWLYTPVATNAATDLMPKKFIFLVSTNSTCNDGFVVAVTNQVNCYNFLAPFTNGSTYYWKVGYINPADTNSPATWTTLPDSWAAAPFAWSEVRTFTISSNATIWDRHYFADTRYLAQKGQHPHLLFNSSNLPLVRAWIQTNAYEMQWWQYLTNLANQVVTNSWWPYSIPDDPNTPPDVWANDIGTVAFVWQMTQNPVYSNAVPALTNLANWYITNRASGYVSGAMGDAVADYYWLYALRAIAFGYDWLYQCMDSQQKSNTLRALELRAAYILRGYNQFWFDWNPKPFGGGDTNGDYVGGFSVRISSQAKHGTSHGAYNSTYSFIAALAAFNDGPRCNDLFNFMMNYDLGVTYPFGADGDVNVGRSYAAGSSFLTGGQLGNDILASTCFPEIGFNKNPYWMRHALWWQLASPVMFQQHSGGWGDVDSGPFYTWRHPLMGKSLALFLQDGGIYQVWQNEVKWMYNPYKDTYDTILVPFHFPPPAPAACTNQAGVFLTGGWAMSLSQPPGTAAGFTNGIGIVFQARPRGNVYAHDYYSDLSYQIWAYGANVTDAAQYYPSEYSHHPMSHYCLLANGLGPCQPTSEQGQIEQYYCRLLAYTNCDDYTYFAAEGAAAYPRSDFMPSARVSQIGLQSVAPYSGGPLAGLSNVQRHILFNHKKYFVIYDQLQSQKNCTFTWLYHILEPTLTLNTQNMSFSYTATNWMNGSNVTVYVAHIANIDNMKVTDMTGTNVQNNPITGETYNETPKRAHALWFNSRPSTNFHFLTVIYPVPPGGTIPQITRLDDYTVGVTNGTQGDVISFNPKPTTPATLVINSPYVSARLAPPGNLRPK